MILPALAAATLFASTLAGPGSLLLVYLLMILSTDSEQYSRSETTARRLALLRLVPYLGCHPHLAFRLIPEAFSLCHGVQLVATAVLVLPEVAP